ncbi:MAG: hypothetical protein IJ809_03655 [Clostridia bacterium]|nr:hypothetical protein [Clostridia bacterium]
MFGESGKNKVMIFFMFLMAAYFIGINFLKQIDKTNSNNTYVSLNLVYSSKEEYIEEYIENIKNNNFEAAYNMLDNSSKEKFGNVLSEFREYAKRNYKEVKSEVWKLNINKLSEEVLRNVSIYNYEVLDGDDKDLMLIPKITVYEYAINVFKIGL